MEEINLKELAKFFISKISFVIAITIIFFIGGFIYINYLLTPMYHSSTTLILVSDNKNESSNLIQSDINLNKNLVTTYSEIVKSRTVLSQVISKLKLNMSVEELSKKISVTSIENTEIIKIQVSNENNKIAEKIAETTAKVFMKEIKNIYNLTNISIVDKASIENKPYNINPFKQLLISSGIGVILSTMILFLVFYFDTSIKSSNDIEEKLGLSVIGNVVYVEDKKRKRKSKKRG